MIEAWGKASKATKDRVDGVVAEDVVVPIVYDFGGLTGTCRKCESSRFKQRIVERKFTRCCKACGDEVVI